MASLTWLAIEDARMSEVNLGALCWNQYTDWPSLLAAGRQAEALGYDTRWS